MIRRMSWGLCALRGKSAARKLEAACIRVPWRGRGGQFVELLESRRLLSGVIYVDHAATGTNDGSSWTNAFTSLQPALTEASSVSSATNPITIEVAQGTYVPTQVNPNPSPFNSSSFNPTPTFTIPEGVTLEGGFAGNTAFQANGTNPGTQNV
jgi:hypothetical protein